MSIQIEYGSIGMAEPDHRIANSLASLSSVIRLQRIGISTSGKTFSTEQVCMLLDDIDAQRNSTDSLAQAPVGNGA
jgi:two-component sensor histidine kinase